MSYDDYDAAREAMLEDYVPKDEAFDHVIENDYDKVVRYVLENSYDEVRHTIDEDRAGEWFKDGRFWLDLLNIISGYDREQLRAAIRREIGPDNQPDPDGMLSQAEFFSIASQISEFLESVRSPYAGQYGVGDDIAWIERLIGVTRAFRELLLAVPHPMEPPSQPATAETKVARTNLMAELAYHLKHQEAERVVKSTIEKSIATLNEAVQQATLSQLKIVISPIGAKEKEPRIGFQKELGADVTPLHVGLAGWMAEYLTIHLEFLQLAVCVECGRIFQRVRRDNVYCSKTCQNRVAYKRKKIFEAGLLREVRIEPRAVEHLKRGLCVYHPRLGLGVVEDVRYERELHVEDQRGNVIRLALPDGSTAEQGLEQLSKLSRPLVKYVEAILPGSTTARVRFLPVVRILSFSDLFGKKTEAGGLTFYQVVDRARLAQLL